MNFATASQATTETADAIASSWGDLWRLIEAAAEQPREALALPMDITRVRPACTCVVSNRATAR